MESLSVLITSVSSKVPMVNAVAAALSKVGAEGRVFGADADQNCLSKYFVDGFWSIPRDEYLAVEEVIAWCRDNSVSVIFPSRDGELLFWARHKNLLSECGISVMVSNTDSVSTCLDKLAFYRQCEALGFPVIYTARCCEPIDVDRLVVKERFGAGASNVGVALTHDQALQLSSSLSAPVFQPYVEGDEISADLYIAQCGDVVGVVLRQRNIIVNGESQVTTTFQDESLVSLCKELAAGLELRGHVMFQIIIDKYFNPHVVECNCRFGGASTLSLAAGLDSFYWFLLESIGADWADISVELASMPLCQIRYAADKVVPA